MKITKNQNPVINIYNSMKSGEITINRHYQRSKALWPSNARSYFIDTVLNNFPFPKIILRQTVDLSTRKTKTEIIDGQQRLTTIRDFIENKFKLSSVSKNFKGMYFDDLDDDLKESFYAYEISADIITSGSDEDVLEVFRRINSYTLPLNTAEKRHASFQGEFKWFIYDISDQFRPFFDKYNVLSKRDLARMMDADLITECVQVYLYGITNRSAKKLDKIYREFDESFPKKDELNEVLLQTLEFVRTNLDEVFDTFQVSSYMFYTIFGALIFNKFGISDENDELDNYEPEGVFTNDIEGFKVKLSELLVLVEQKDDSGHNKDFVKASIATTHSKRNRLTRIKKVIDILQP